MSKNRQQTTDPDLESVFCHLWSGVLFKRSFNRIHRALRCLFFVLRPRRFARTSAIHDQAHCGLHIDVFGTQIDAPRISAIETALRADDDALQVTEIGVHRNTTF